MGKITETISKIQKEENITLPELFEKYPHLAKLQYEEQLEEQSVCKNTTCKNTSCKNKKCSKTLLCD
tara:strand:+ start:2345 stop:2545 length:201 start_codon:yes stop_codon:yes gene_type:complete